jgi:hypothetical protein
MVWDTFTLHGLGTGLPMSSCLVFGFLPHQLLFVVEWFVAWKKCGQSFGM